MSPWLWVLAGLCIPAVILPAVAAVAVFRWMGRLQARVDELQESRLFTTLTTTDRLTGQIRRSADRAQILSSRAQRAVETIKESVAASGLAEMRAALLAAGDEIRGLGQDLR